MKKKDDKNKDAKNYCIFWCVLFWNKLKHTIVCTCIRNSYHTSSTQFSNKHFPSELLNRISFLPWFNKLILTVFSPNITGSIVNHGDSKHWRALLKGHYFIPIHSNEWILNQRWKRKFLNKPNTYIFIFLVFISDIHMKYFLLLFKDRARNTVNSKHENKWTRGKFILQFTNI